MKWILTYTPYADLLEADPEEWAPAVLVPVDDVVLYLAEDDPSQLLGFYVESATRFTRSDAVGLVLGDELLFGVEQFVKDRVLPLVSELPRLRDVEEEDLEEVLAREPEPLIVETLAPAPEEVAAARLVALEEFERYMFELHGTPTSEASRILVILTDGLSLLGETLAEFGQAVADLIPVASDRDSEFALAAADWEARGGDEFESDLGYFKIWADEDQLWIEGTVHVTGGSAERPVTVTVELTPTVVDLVPEDIEMDREASEITVAANAASNWTFRIPIARLDAAPPPGVRLVERLDVLVGEPSTKPRGSACEELPAVLPAEVVTIFEDAWWIAYYKALTVLNSPTDAEIVADEAICKMINDWEEIKAWKAWIRTTSYNESISLWRRRKGRMTVELESTRNDDTPLPPLEPLRIPSSEEDTIAAVMAENLLAVLPSRCREIFDMRSQGYDLLETARRLGLAHGTVRNNASQCVELARQWLQRLGYE